MSSPSDPGVPLMIAATQQPFRLLELPPELLELLTLPNPPKLQFKSPETDDLVNAPEAVLCSPDKTYIIRQQQTSNGVHVLVPTSLETDVDGAVHSLGVSAIAQCTSSLELMPAPADSAKSTLAALLPLFRDSMDDQIPYGDCHDKDYIFANTPMSGAECGQAWSDLVAFEVKPSWDLPRRCFRPSSHVLFKTWSRLVEISRAEGINLAGTLRTDTMLEAVWNIDEEWPHELRVAMLNRLSSNRAAMSTQEHAETALLDDSTLDRAATVQWVGLCILKAQSEPLSEMPRVSKAEFVDIWKDNLPEEWREDASLDVLPKDSYAFAGNYIHHTNNDAEKLAQQIASSSTVTKTVKAASGRKRHWHEKFAAARKQRKNASS